MHCFRGLKQGRVRFAMGLRRIRVIREKAEEQIGLFVGEIADFKLFRLGLDRLRVHQHHRARRPASGRRRESLKP